MALILNDANIAASIEVPKVIETKNGMVLNAQYYNKQNFLPVPFNQLIISGKNDMLNINKALKPMADSTSIGAWNEDTIIADEYEPNVFYGLSYNGVNTIIFKYLEEENKGIKLLGNISQPLLYDKYLGQDKNYLYYSFRCSVVKNAYINNSFKGAYKGCSDSYIQKINKRDMSVLNMDTYGYIYDPNIIPISMSMNIFEDDNYIYFGEVTNSTARTVKNTFNFEAISSLSIHRIIKARGVIETVKSEIQINDNSIYNYFDNKDVFKIDDNIIGFYFFNFSDVKSPLKLIKINLNETIISDIVTVEPVTFTWEESIKSKLSVFPNGFWYSYEIFITKKETKTFVNIMMYQNSNQAVTGQIVNQGIYTFEIIKFNILKLTNYNRISEAVLKGYLISKDREFLIVATINSVIFMKFNGSLGRYEIKDSMKLAVLSIGLDSSERVWLIKPNYDVELFSLTDATNFNMKFEKNFYDYFGIDIETFITIESRNYIGEYISTEVELNINGNAKFRENDSKTIKLTTPNDGNMSIPVMITGSNQITVYPKLTSTI